MNKEEMTVKKIQEYRKVKKNSKKRRKLFNRKSNFIFYKLFTKCNKNSLENQ